MVEPHAQTLSDRDFARLTRLVEETVGIHLPGHKRSMVELRLSKRARAIGMPDLAEYCAHVFDGGSDDEAVSVIDVLTTNKTDFFREADHFERLVSRVIPECRERYPEAGRERPFRVWSAGCSTGEEPYTLAMVLTDHAYRHPPLDFVVHATDVSTRALADAVRAVYPEEHVCAVPVGLRSRCLLRHKDHSTQLVRVAPEVRDRVRFSRHNLLSPTPPGPDRYDAIFCRNVIIYFERETQVRVLRNLLRALLPGGFLFVGHSETLHGMPVAADRVGPTLYQKRSD